MPHIPLPFDPSLLDRYLSGEASADEVRLIEQWLSTHPKERTALHVLRAGMAERGGPLPPYDQDARIAAVVDYNLGAARRQRRQTLQETKRFNPNLSKWTLPRVPILIAIACLIAVAGVLIGRQTELSRMHARRTPIIYTTNSGQRANITLPDGSTVALNVASRLEVPTDYLDGNRHLRLTGEALFTVLHHTGSVFTVTSGATTANVLGTSFFVRHYPHDSGTVVAVRNGKVGVRSLVLTEGQQSEITAQGTTPVHAIAPSQFTFVSGVLTLADMPLRDAVVELSRWYDLDIRLGDPTLGTQSVGGGFAAGAQSDMIEVFEKVLDLRVVRDGRTITLFSRSR
jgi:ferric-dicitrate binding protein FerR (iron transport regulator)